MSGGGRRGVRVATAVHVTRLVSGEAVATSHPIKPINEECSSCVLDSRPISFQRTGGGGRKLMDGVPSYMSPSLGNWTSGEDDSCIVPPYHRGGQVSSMATEIRDNSCVFVVSCLKKAVSEATGFDRPPHKDPVACK